MLQHFDVGWTHNLQIAFYFSNAPHNHQWKKQNSQQKRCLLTALLLDVSFFWSCFFSTNSLRAGKLSRYCCLLVPRVGKRFYCNHCSETVSKSTFYEHKAIYGSACGIPSHDEQKEVEANLDSDSDNENLDLSLGDEDMHFFLKAPVAWVIVEAKMTWPWKILGAKEYIKVPRNQNSEPWWVRQHVWWF